MPKKIKTPKNNHRDPAKKSINQSNKESHKKVLNVPMVNTGQMQAERVEQMTAKPNKNQNTAIRNVHGEDTDFKMPENQTNFEESLKLMCHKFIEHQAYMTVFKPSNYNEHFTHEGNGFVEKPECSHVSEQKSQLASEIKSHEENMSKNKHYKKKLTRNDKVLLTEKKKEFDQLKNCDECDTLPSKETIQFDKSENLINELETDLAQRSALPTFQDRMNEENIRLKGKLEFAELDLVLLTEQDEILNEFLKHQSPLMELLQKDVTELKQELTKLNKEHYEQINCIKESKSLLENQKRIYSCIQQTFAENNAKDEFQDQRIEKHEKLQKVIFRTIEKKDKKIGKLDNKIAELKLELKQLMSNGKSIDEVSVDNST